MMLNKKRIIIQFVFLSLAVSIHGAYSVLTESILLSALNCGYR